ncbi:uroporphyrinogen-III synthase [Chitinophaga sp. SYP-B3965]|uniref:uroporphyrinogen-III synthase n=1 Tax=Chitinophaga sp. SYP-B3965 TaxID=2663120 RepID=UPI0015630B2F|nr:uroporphyrinogen-III synthase [Chitinophaga sp. SYP-B3965]
MSNAKYRILSTKPLSQTLVQLAGAHDIAISAQAFIDVQPTLTPELTTQSMQHFIKGSTLVFTSPNAVKIVSRALHYNDTPEKKTISKVYCLQGATRKAVEEHLHHVTIAGTALNSKELAELIVAEHNIPSVVFFCGRIRRNELPDVLQEHNVAVEEIVVYDTVETPATLEEEYDGVLFLSSSSVKSFFSANTLPKHTVCFAIGTTTAASLEDITNNRIIVSPEPAVDLLVQTAIFYFDNINCYE